MTPTSRHRSRSKTPSPAIALRLPISSFLVANIALLVLALGLGGASRENAWPAAIVEVASLAILPWAVLRLSQASHFGSMKWPLFIITAVLAIPLVQLTPLSPTLWGALPVANKVKAVYQAAGIALPVRPLSVAPAYTIHSALALTTPITVFLSWSSLSLSERRLGTVGILAMVLAGLVLGTVQIASGGTSAGYLYSNTNYGLLVGFFSNRNHEATLLLCSLPLTLSLLAGLKEEKLGKPAIIIMSVGLAFIVILALVAVRSRAGVLLLGPTLLASLLILLRSGRFKSSSYKLGFIIGGVAIIALTLVVFLGLGPILARFDSNNGPETRFLAAPYIWKAALKYLPLGSGLGSFDLIFRSVEPLAMVQPAFLNHAHDDYLEVLLETGLLGVLALALFVSWWIFRVVKSWTSKHASYRVLAQGGGVVVGILLAHSALDYPVRTLAIETVLGFSCALMVRPAT